MLYFLNFTPFLRDEEIFQSYPDVLSCEIFGFLRHRTRILIYMTKMLDIPRFRSIEGSQRKRQLITAIYTQQSSAQYGTADDLAGRQHLFASCDDKGPIEAFALAYSFSTKWSLLSCMYGAFSTMTFSRRAFLQVSPVAESHGRPPAVVHYEKQCGPAVKSYIL